MDRINSILLYDKVAKDSNGDYLVTSKNNMPLWIKFRDTFLNQTLLTYPLVALFIVLFGGMLKIDWLQYLLVVFPGLLIIVSTIQVKAFRTEHKNVVIPLNAISSVCCNSGKCVITYREENSKYDSKRVIRYVNDNSSATVLRNYFGSQVCNVTDMNGGFYHLNVILGVIALVPGIAIMICSFILPSLFSVRWVSFVIVAVSLFIIVYFSLLKRKSA